MPTEPSPAQDAAPIDEPLQARSLRIVQWAIALSFGSQFLNYESDTTRGHITTIDPRSRYNSDYAANDYTGITISGSGAATGWDLHSLAIPVLAALAFLYFTRAHRHTFWMRWGHWIAVLMFVSISGGAQVRAFGATLGAVAVAGAVWSALVHRRALLASAVPLPLSPGDAAPVAADKPVAPPPAPRQKAPPRPRKPKAP